MAAGPRWAPRFAPWGARGWSHAAPSLPMLPPGGCSGPRCGTPLHPCSVPPATAGAALPCPLGLRPALAPSGCGTARGGRDPTGLCARTRRFGAALPSLSRPVPHFCAGDLLLGMPAAPSWAPGAPALPVPIEPMFPCGFPQTARPLLSAGFQSHPWPSCAMPDLQHLCSAPPSFSWPWRRNSGPVRVPLPGPPCALAATLDPRLACSACKCCNPALPSLSLEPELPDLPSQRCGLARGCRRAGVDPHPGALAPEPGPKRLLPGRLGVREWSWPRAAAHTGREEAASTLPAVSPAGSQRGKKEALCSSCPPCPSALPAGEKTQPLLHPSPPDQDERGVLMQSSWTALPRSREHRSSPDHQHTGTAARRLRPPAPPATRGGSPGPAAPWEAGAAPAPPPRPDPLPLCLCPSGVPDAAGGWATPGLCSFQPCPLQEGMGGWWGVPGSPCSPALAFAVAEPPRARAVCLLWGRLYPLRLLEKPWGEMGGGTGPPAPPAAAGEGASGLSPPGRGCGSQRPA